MRVLITGASGFVGRRVAELASRQPGLTEVRLLARSRLPHPSRPARRGSVTVRTVPGDLTDPRSLRGVCDRVDAVVHCASLIGGTEDACTAVNVHGTRALLDEAERSGVARVVGLSTAAVYGRGPFRATRAADAPVAPVSATSRTRFAADRAVRDAGGTVLRPHLVYGPGDRWLRPGLVGLQRALGASVDGWSARSTVIAVADLARLLVLAAVVPSGRLRSSVYHAGYSAPASIAALIRHTGARPETEHGAVLSPTAARRRLRDQGATGLLTALDIAAVDHWFDCADTWRDLTGLPSPAPPADPDVGGPGPRPHEAGGGSAGS